jgi:hypothetical protein
MDKMSETGQMREEAIKRAGKRSMGQKREITQIRHKRDVGQKRQTENLIKDMGKRERWGS